jgi:YD repeat-containing protein
VYAVDDMNAGGRNVGTLLQYDGLNRLIATLQDHTGTAATLNTTTQYTYDTRDNLRSVTDPDSVPTGCVPGSGVEV